MYDDLFDLIVEGAFANKEEFDAFVNKSSPEEIFSLVTEGAFADIDEFKSMYSSGAPVVDVIGNEVKKKGSTGSSSGDGSLDSQGLYEQWEQKYNISQAGVSPIPSLDELQVDDDMRDTRVFEEEPETTTSGEAPKQKERTLFGELSTEKQDATRIDKGINIPTDTQYSDVTSTIGDVDRSKPIILPEETVATGEIPTVPIEEARTQKERTLFGELSTEKQDATRVDKGVDIPTEVRDQESYLPRGSKEIFNQELKNVTAELIGKEEQFVVPQMNFAFGD